VCVSSFRYPACNADAQCCHLWPVWMYHIFPHYLINSTILGERIGHKALLRVKGQRYILHEIRKRKANSIGHILHRNCLLQRVIEEKIKGGIEVTGRQGRRRRKLLGDHNP